MSLSENELKEISGYMNDMYGQYSNITHNNFPNPIEAAFVPTFNNRQGYLELSVFGKVTTYSIDTIKTLNTNLFLYLVLFSTSLMKHNLKVIEEDKELEKLFIEFFLLGQTFAQSYIESNNKSK